MNSFSYRQALSFLVVGAIAACATEGAQPDGEASGDNLLANYTTPDPNNPWTRGVDLSKLEIGEETILPNETAMFDGFADDIGGLQKRLVSVNGAPVRGFHAKAHACVGGQLKVDVPASLGSRAKVGIFAENKTYSVWLRYSNGTGFVQSDKKSDARGLAIKLVKVPGKKLLPGAEDALTQDFLMTNGATTPASNVAEFVEFAKMMADSRMTTDGQEVGALEGLVSAGSWLLKPEHKRVREFLLSKTIPRSLTHGSMLGEQFWTGGAFAMGVESGDPMHARATGAAKMTAIAGLFQNGRCVPVSQLPKPSDDNYFRNDLRERMKTSETCIDLRVQLQADAAKQPIEDTSVEWREDDAPFTSIGIVRIPRIDLDDAASEASESFCNALTFSPWHTLPEHRPLGNIMRARLPVYVKSATTRGGAPEPTGDEKP